MTSSRRPTEDQYQLAPGAREPMGERSGLEALAAFASNVIRIETTPAQLGDLAPGERSRFVVGVVENLDLEQLARVANPAHRVEQPLGDVHLVVEGKLNRHARQPDRERLW